jgi:hypothetical protein
MLEILELRARYSSVTPEVGLSVIWFGAFRDKEKEHIRVMAIMISGLLEALQL